MFTLSDTFHWVSICNVLRDSAKNAFCVTILYALGGITLTHIAKSVYLIIFMVSFLCLLVVLILIVGLSFAKICCEVGWVGVE